MIENHFVKQADLRRGIQQNRNGNGLASKYILTLSLYVLLTILIYYTHPRLVGTYSEHVHELKTWTIPFMFLFNVLLGKLFNVKLLWLLPFSFVVLILQALIARLLFHELLSFTNFSSLNTSIDEITKQNVTHYLALPSLLIYLFQHTIHFILWKQISRINKFQSHRKQLNTT